MRSFAPIAAALLALAACRGEAPAPGNDAAPSAPAEAEGIPAPFQGSYAADAAACGRPDDSRLAVSATELRFHESVGTVREVAVEAPRRIRVAADFEGEGRRWSAEHRLSLSEDGGTLAVAGQGASFDRVRCPAAAQPQPSAGWGGEGGTLYYAGSGGRALNLVCPSGSGELLVNVPGFRPVGSEERMSFGSGGTVVALVADTRGDRERGGVTGRGPVPAELATILGGPVAVNYGAQDSGPHPAPPAGLARAFAAACGRGGSGAPTPPAPDGPPAGQVSACLMQGDERLRVRPLRAVGTEPFWAARIEGRCVTYSHPEDQDGARVWTRYTPAANGGGTWSGALGGRLFELRVRAQAGCSDGMSDRRYPLAVELFVGGERRRGCAAPA